MAKKSIRRTDPFADAWVGPWLRGVREGREVSAASIVETLSARGVSVDRGRLSLFERGHSCYRADQVPELLVAYGVSVFDYAAEMHRRVEAVRGATGAGTGGVAHRR